MKQMSTMIKEGYYRATIMKVTTGKRVATKNGLEDTLVVTFRTEDGDRVSTQLLMTDYSTLWKQLLEVTALTEDKNPSMREMHNKACGIEIQHEFSGTTYYAKVVDICHNDELVEDNEPDDE